MWCGWGGWGDMALLCRPPRRLSGKARDWFMIFIITILRNNEGYFFGAGYICAIVYIIYKGKKKTARKDGKYIWKWRCEKKTVVMRGIVVAMMAVCARTRSCVCVWVCGRVWWSGMGLKGLHQNDILKGRQCSIVMTSGHHYSSLGQWRAYTYRWMMADQN